MNILADLTIGTPNFTVGNIITISTTFITLVGFFFKMRNDVNNLKQKDEEQGQQISKHSDGINDIDKHGSIAFRQYKEVWDKQSANNDSRLLKIEDILPKIEKMSFNIDIITKWIERQENKSRD